MIMRNHRLMGTFTSLRFGVFWAGRGYVDISPLSTLEFPGTAIVAIPFLSKTAWVIEPSSLFPGTAPVAQPFHFSQHVFSQPFHLFPEMVGVA